MVSRMCYVPQYLTLAVSDNLTSAVSVYLNVLAPKMGISRGQGAMKFLPILEPIDQFNGLTEIAASNGHDHVDGVEVLLATETPGQIGFGIGGGVELGAQGTKKAQVALRDLAGETKEIGDDSSDGNIVAKHPEFFLGIAG